MNKPEDGPALDANDYGAALQNEDSMRRFFVVDEAKELAEILNAPLEQWRIFLHPAQQKTAAMEANGPVRVLGGAGTGKTVVAMHRARHLAGKVFNGKTDRVLFTTFTRNLATDIYENLRKLCAPEELSRIEVINLDAWVANFLRARGFAHKVLYNEEGNECWESAMNVAPAGVALSQGFYRSEWEEIVQAQDIRSADQYMRASRLGRGARLSRAQKRLIWPVFQEYRAQFNEHGAKEYVDLIRAARELILNKGIQLPYRAVIVDEAQDMSAEAFRLIRAIVPEGRNDIFVVGDAHQRIYRHRASLGKCGINIRGRGKKLKISYRTTEEIRRYAVRLLEGREFDDLDGGADNQKGFMSLTHGPAPEVRLCSTFADEVELLKKHLLALKENGASMESTCIVARTRKIMESYEDCLQGQGFQTYRIRRDAAEQREKPGLRIATMHRVKGLEFDHIVVVSANQDIIPLAKAVSADHDAAARRRAETSERALLYVALTRAKRSALITAHGALSPFVHSL